MSQQKLQAVNSCYHAEFLSCFFSPHTFVGSALYQTLASLEIANSEHQPLLPSISCIL